MKKAKEKLGLMVDIETWGTSASAVIRQISIVPFMWNTLEEISEAVIFYPYEIEQINYGRTKDQATMKWWAEQNHDVNAAIVDNQLKQGQPCADVARAIKFYVDKLKKDYSVSFVARGATTFDYPILDNFIQMFTGYTLGIAFYRVYDLRSLTSMLQNILMEKLTVHEEGKSHDAFHDCMEQIEQLRRVKKLLIPS